MVWNKEGTHFASELQTMAQSLAELRAAEAEVAREWTWLHAALNEMARVRTEQGEVQAFRLMQAQAMAVGQRRIELSIRIAELEQAASATQIS